MNDFIIRLTMVITSISILVSGCATTGDRGGIPVQGSLSPTAVEKPVSPLIHKVSFIEEEKFTRILIEGTELPPPLYKMSQEPPLRITLDFPLTDLKGFKSPLKIANGTISEITSTQYDDKGRIEIGLLEMTSFNIWREGRAFFIDIEKAQRVKEIQEGKKAEEKRTEVKEITSLPEERKDEVVQEPEKEILATPIPSPIERTTKAREIIDVSLEKKNDYVTINILADGPLGNYNLFKLDGPPRLVLDIWEVGTQYPKKSIRFSNPYIREVRIGQHQDRLRLVFDSSRSNLPPYQIHRMEDKLILSLGKVPQSQEPQIFLASSSPAPVPKELPPVAPSARATESKKVKAKIALKEIHFKQIDAKSRLMLALTGEPQFETYRLSEKLIAIDIKNAFAPKHLKRSLNTREFHSAVDQIDVQNIKQDLRILVKLKEDMPYETLKEGHTLFFDIKNPERVPAKLDPPKPLPVAPREPQPPPVEEVRPKAVEAKKEEEKPPQEIQKEVAAPPRAKEKMPSPEVAKPPEEVSAETPLYTGRRISLDFKDADIKNILRLIAEVSNFNIITADDVTGKITMRLVDVPWDQALDVILQSRNLGKVQIGNVIRIAPIETLRRESQARLEEKRAKERLEDTIIELIPVNYATAKDIIPQIKGVLSERGDVKVDDRTNTLIVKDIPRNIPAVKSLVKSLDTKTPQVLIEARIVEANLTFQRELGVKWGFELGGGKVTAQGGLADNMIVNLPAIPKVGTAGIVEFLISRGTIQQLDIAVSAHEHKGDVKIISSPKIATLHNREATIEQGVRLPIPKIDPQSGQISIEYVEANLKLAVTPLVTNDGHIKMGIRAKKDAPDFGVQVNNVPSIDKKEAVTEVLVRDNGVVMIAGVYSIEKSDGTEGIPLFSKIPLLGWLFKREAKEDKRRDLLIFISPRIIKDQV